LVIDMTRIASPRITDASSDTASGLRQMCPHGGALYTMWPITFAGSHLMYAMAFAAAQQRVRELEQSRVPQPSMN
jgi:hypothetical protein